MGNEIEVSDDRVGVTVREPWIEALVPRLTDLELAQLRIAVDLEIDKRVQV